MLSFERFFPKELALRLAERLSALEQELTMDFQRTPMRDAEAEAQIRLRRFEEAIRTELKEIENTRR